MIKLIRKFINTNWSWREGLLIAVLYFGAMVGLAYAADWTLSDPGYDGIIIWDDSATGSEVIFVNEATFKSTFNMEAGTDFEAVVTEGSLADSTIVSDDIKDGEVVAADIGTNAVKVDELDVSDVSDNIAGDIAEGELADSIILTADIKDGEIVNADINDAAAIVGSKLDLSEPGVIGGTTPAAGSFAKITANAQAFTPLAAEPTEVVGNLYVADNEVAGWDPADYAGTNDYLVICTAVDSPGTFKILMDMVTGERFFSTLTLPNGTAPTVDAVGEIGLDTTDDQIVVYDGGAVAVYHKTHTECVVFENLAAGDDDYEIWMANDAVTITGIGVHCRGTCTTGADISLEDRSGNAMTHTTPTHSTGTDNSTWQSVTAANILVAGEGLRIDVDNTVDPETDEYTICFTYTYNRQ